MEEGGGAARPGGVARPVNGFSMVHGRARAECRAVVSAIRRAIHPEAAAALWSVREFKKVRLQLFTPDYARWERTL